eukprot:CAMPEP_0181077238 /NCGR_PEP_ID=MMETSP1071-20121207/845_1 /TAXON_ID=35127 /ORGANISM="Thalassiosira sp., Strain NH16" /LENGTH=696 /DNA_ID=CAMNT_0023158471 /DNA_START=978 /DNA_END=3068 /DNA_ORIENTATION=-
MTLSTVASYSIQTTRSFRLVIARGSVIDFEYPLNPSRSAIVNAANEGCLGGGGVDGAIGDAGGPMLLADREKLPEAPPGSGVRCPTGRAVMTGPNSYGDLHTPYVIHAVGPNYLNYTASEELSIGDKLLSSAYTSCMECGEGAHVEAMAFCLLSAGIFRGKRSLKEVLKIGLEAICQFEGYAGLKSVYVCGFTKNELDVLVDIADGMGLSKVALEINGGVERDTTLSAEPRLSANQSSHEPKKHKVHNQHLGKDDEAEQKEKLQEEKVDDGSTLEEWEIRRDELKSTADSHFRSKSYALATQAYQDALQLDPTNHIILSNKSAAHLANGEKSKALHDARQCVKHASSWAKGHTRLAAAMASLGRFTEAAKVYSKVLNELDSKNAVAKKGLEDCRSKQKQATEAKERDASKLQMELDRQKADKEGKEKQRKEVEIKASKGAENEEDDLLDDFFSEVEKVSEKPKPSKSDEARGKSDGGDESNNNRIKLQINDLGASTSQIDRLLQVNHEWKNLNPFYVLDIPHTVDDDSVISARYRALSLLVHPDKCPDDPVRAKDAFEQVRKAMSQMNDSDKRRHVQALVEQGMKQGKRDWEAEKSEGNNCVTDPGKEEEGLMQAQNKATMKIFAEIEHRRRNIERRKHDFEQRERAQEDEEKAKEKNEREHDKNWREGERVEKRIGSWRNFQGGGKKGGKMGRFN